MRRRFFIFLFMFGFIFITNALLVLPREMHSDSAWLISELNREPRNRDVRRMGPLTVGPTTLALGESLEVVVASGDVRQRHAVVLLAPTGEHLEVRFDPVGRQSIRIPEEGPPGRYAIWLCASNLTPASGISVVSIEVYRTVAQEEYLNSIYWETYGGVYLEVYGDDIDLLSELLGFTPSISYPEREDEDMEAYYIPP